MSNRTLTDSQIERLVGRVAPGWRVTDATPADSGHHAVYYLTAATPNGRREVVLKTVPSDGGHGVAVESRIQSLLTADTAVPVPEVIGAVDTADSGVPTPAYLMERVGGEALRRDDLGRIGEPAVRRIARQLGRHLAELHGVDAVERFGVVEAADLPSLDGGSPSADPTAIRVRDGRADWTDTVETWIDEALDGLDDGRFADLRPRVEPVLRARAEALSGPFRPALAHVDASLENHRWEPETGELTAVLDWGFTVAATPAYDLACVTHSLGGGHWAFLPETPDYRETVRGPLAEGYREAADATAAGVGGTPRVPVGRVVERFHEHWDCYGLLALTRTMSLFDWYENWGIGPERRGAAAERLREAVEEWT